MIRARNWRLEFRPSLHRRWLLCIAVGLVVFVTAIAGAAGPQGPGRVFDNRTAPLFEFHCNFWVNLHQLLFHEALVRIGKPDRRLQSNVPLDGSQMNSREKAAWSGAVTFYLNRFGNRQELFDPEMVNINDRLAAQPDDGTSADMTGLPPELISNLQSATARATTSSDRSARTAGSVPCHRRDQGIGNRRLSAEAKPKQHTVLIV